jgi:alanine transaminase
MTSSSSSSNSQQWDHTLTINNINPCIKSMEYAVRGPLVIRATEIEKEIEQGVKKPFENVIKANIGDAHAMGNPAVTFIRQVLALVTHPELLKSKDFPEDAKERANAILQGCKGGSVGSYSDSPGVEVIRRHVADYIERRDGGIKSDWQNVVLCAGASEGIRAVMKLLTNPNGGDGSPRPGVMIPIPQYPLYSASLAEYNIDQIGYYLNEESNWSLELDELERSYAESLKSSVPKAIVVINPGNPTGQVLSRQNIENIIKFAHKHHLFIFADEVYQDNVYADGCKFYSFKKVMNELGAPYDQMEMASFMSCSKGYAGECGIRGGYSELVNLDGQVKAMLLKSISAKLCPTVIGQACMDVIVNPPHSGEPSFESFSKQRTSILASLAERAKLVADTLNGIEGFSCNTVQGAMYAFPRIHLPVKAIEKAKSVGQAPDVFYAFQLLENTGICVVPGSGFGQRPGTYHFRTTILPQKDMIVSMLDRLRTFHLQFLKEYAD